MPISMRLEFQITAGPNGERPTLGDLRRWVDLARKQGAADSDELELMLDHRDDVEGFYIFTVPQD